MRFHFSDIGCIIAALTLASCNAPQATNHRVAVGQSPSAPSSPQGPYEIVGTAIPYEGGVRCGVKGRLGPPSYSVYDIGKVGVPRLSEKQMVWVKRLKESDKTKTLRFAKIQGRIIMYNAVYGPCAAVIYGILNHATCRNEVYLPLDEPYHITAGSGC